MPSAEVVKKIAARFPVESVSPNYAGEVARRYRYADGEGEFGVISSVTAPFCGDCSRARVSAEGVVYTCLFATSGHDLRGLLRDGADDDRIETFMRKIWTRRTDRYSEVR